MSSFHRSSRKSKFQEFRSGVPQGGFIANKDFFKRCGFLDPSHHQAHLFLTHCRKKRCSELLPAKACQQSLLPRFCAVNGSSEQLGEISVLL